MTAIKGTAASTWLIAGPTASGKSSLALALAERIGGVVVNADSMQLYRDLRVLTARPPEGDEARVPHRLYGAADASERWSVGRWQRAASQALKAATAEGRPSVFVGGTGLYFRALIEGLAAVPPIPGEVRTRAGALFDAVGEAAFRDKLRAGDPEAAGRIAPADRQRLVRAWEVLEATGVPLSALPQGDPPLAPGTWRAVVLEPPRAELYARCDARVRTMVGGGALAEVEALLARRLSPELPAMKAIGVREFGAAVAGEITLEAAIEDVARQTRRYAKRQMTWFRNQTPAWPRLTSPKLEALLAS